MTFQRIRRSYRSYKNEDFFKYMPENFPVQCNGCGQIFNFGASHECPGHWPPGSSYNDWALTQMLEKLEQIAAAIEKISQNTTATTETYISTGFDPH